MVCSLFIFEDSAFYFAVVGDEVVVIVVYEGF